MKIRKKVLLVTFVLILAGTTIFCTSCGNKDEEEKIAGWMISELPGMSGVTVGEYSTSELKAFDAEGKRNGKEYATIQYFTDVDKAEFDAYIKKLESNGFVSDSQTEAQGRRVVSGYKKSSGRANRFCLTFTESTGTLSISQIVGYSAEKTDTAKGKGTLSIATYNIKTGRYKTSDSSEPRTISQNFENIAKEILKYAPDIIGFQEVDMGADRTNNVDQIKQLAELTGYPYCQFTKAINIKGGSYGHAILSRYPIVSHEVTKIPKATSSGEDRALSHAVIDVNGTEVNFFNTHLNANSPEMFQKVAMMCNGYSNAILVGDFNSWYQDGNFAVFEDYECVNVGNHITTLSLRSIDNICYTEEFRTICSGVAPEDHSDHLYVYALFEYDKEK